jgi:hypothetical protein
MMVSYWPGNRPHVTARHPGHGYRVGSLPVADAGGDEGVSPDGSAGIVAGGTGWSVAAGGGDVIGGDSSCCRASACGADWGASCLPHAAASGASSTTNSKGEKRFGDKLFGFMMSSCNANVI